MNWRMVISGTAWTTASGTKRWLPLAYPPIPRLHNHSGLKPCAHTNPSSLSFVHGGTLSILVAAARLVPAASGNCPITKFRTPCGPRAHLLYTSTLHFISHLYPFPFLIMPLFSSPSMVPYYMASTHNIKWDGRYTGISSHACPFYPVLSHVRRISLYLQI